MNRILTTEQWQESLAEAFSKAVKSACQDLIDEAVKAEREACALVAEDWDNDSADPRDIAAAIRERSTND